MSRFFGSLCILLLICTSTTFAQFEETGVRNLFFDTLRGGDVQPTLIGIDPMKYVGNEYINAEDSNYMRHTSNIIESDVDFHADFEIVMIDSFYLRTYEIAELGLLGWKALGASLVVRLEAEFPGNNMRVIWKLYESRTQRQVAKGKVEHNRLYWREIGHDIANDIVHTLTGENGPFRSQIAYIKKSKSGHKEVFIADYDGANERQLTFTNSINISPVFSPDGKTIYFTSYVEGSPKLHKVDVESGKMAIVADFKGIVAAPAVSPDGNKIACVLSKDGNSEIYVLSTKGRVIKRLTHHRAIESAPSWSPDGRSIVFTSDRTGRPQLYIMDSDGLNLHRLTYEGSYNDSPIWSKLGNRITFVSRTKRGRFDIASIDTSGHDYRIMTLVGQNENPHFSGDGKHIIFSSTRLGGHDIYTMDITGRNQRRITHYGNVTNPTWGPIP